MRWSVIRQGVTGIVGTAAAIVYTRLLAPEEIGAAALASFVFMGLILLIVFPIRDAVVYYQEEDDAIASAAFWVVLGVSGVSCLLVLAGAGWFARFYDSELAAPLTRAATLAAFARALDVVPSSMLIKQMRFGAVEVLRGVNFFIQAVGWVIFAMLGFGAWSLVLPLIISGVVVAITTWIVVRFKPMLPSRRHMVDIIRFGRSVFGGKLLLYLTANFDNAAVGRLGEASLGFYGVGEAQAEFAAVTVAEAFSQVTLAALAKLQQQAEAFRETFLRMLRLMATFSMPAQIGAFVIADIGFLVIFGEQWLPAVPVFQAYLVFNLLNTVAELCDAATSAAGHPQIRLRINAVQLPFFIVATLFVLNFYGTILSVAVTLSAIRVVFISVYIYLTFRLVGAGWTDFFSTLLPSSAAGLGMGAVCLGLRNLYIDAAAMTQFEDATIAAAASLTVTVVLGGVVFLGLLLIIARESSKQVLLDYLVMIVPEVAQERFTLMRWLRRVLSSAADFDQTNAP